MKANIIDIRLPYFNIIIDFNIHLNLRKYFKVGQGFNMIALSEAATGGAL